MARIAKVIRMEKKNDGEYAIVTVQLDDGSEVGVTVGGEVETYFYKGTGRAFVKKGQRNDART